MTATGVPTTRIDLFAPDEDHRLVRASAPGVPEFSCTAARGLGGQVALHDFRPHRRDPGAAALLLAAAARVGAEFGVAEVVAIHPDCWDADLVGTRRLHRMVHMGLLLDGDLLAERVRPLPDGHAVRPLAPVPDDVLADLSPQGVRPLDLSVWREVRAGAHGPLIDQASVVVEVDGAVVAAVAVTEHHGVPLIGHCVASAEHRGSGFGKAVLLAALTRLIDVGYAECHLHVVEGNWVARRLYRSLGFTAVRPPLRVSLIPVGGGDA
ncbi:GNAT family N-acetyltransferase [Actinokineospora bangkokensis]|uniref:N-acetyltransferase domain-containing protein n=1 Tax=Actinokineospora bangkokensis TaxID=1193682 RepID=A0A1Q9LME5_9PSEU|nr:GNAT family N-acetyltransferase [Actinokineospora bangkokensis]OLR93191.1 hypothetical protein BJP25_16980 [Actinokineospora bangkokensis]